MSKAKKKNRAVLSPDAIKEKLKRAGIRLGTNKKPHPEK